MGFFFEFIPPYAISIKHQPRKSCYLFSLFVISRYKKIPLQVLHILEPPLLHSKKIKNSITTLSLVVAVVIFYHTIEKRESFSSFYMLVQRVFVIHGSVIIFSIVRTTL